MLTRVLSSIDAALPAASTGLFFFQAEDGIRDLYVTGVQTVCSSDLYRSARPAAAPYSPLRARAMESGADRGGDRRDRQMGEEARHPSDLQRVRRAQEGGRLRSARGVDSRCPADVGASQDRLDVV